MLDELKALEAEALQALEQVDEGTLDEWRLGYLGRKGKLTLLLRQIGKLSAEERPAAGRESHRVKSALEGAFDARARVLREQAMANTMAGDAVDVTLPGTVRWLRACGPEQWTTGCLFDQAVSYELMGELFLSGILEMRPSDR